MGIQQLSRSMIVTGDLPIELLADLAMREGRRPRPIYQTHKWFARRFGSAFRGLLVAAAIAPDDDFWNAYLGGANLEGLQVGDPFVGGGTAITEAQRLGAHCYASDVDPVAVSITRFQSRLSAVPPLAATLEQLKATAGKTLSAYHVTLDEQGRRRPVLHYFWVQEIDCGCCGHRYDGHPHFQLAHDTATKRQWVVCRHCGEVHELAIHRKRLNCTACGGRTSIMQGPCVAGNVTCPDCGHGERLIDVSRRTGTPPRYRLFALEYLSKDPDGRPVPASHRIFKRANDHDLERYAAASKHLSECSADLLEQLPDRIIPDQDRADDRLIRYGYRQYLDLFNDRQRLHLATLSQAIKKTDHEVREALSIAFCDHLKTNCMLTSYAFGWRRLAPLFSIRAFRHISRPVELNPWLDGTGRGTYPNAVRRVERARDWMLEPREATPSGGFKMLEKQDRPPMVPVVTRVCSAEELSHIADGALDLVVTDPPYFDNIAYSELSDFFLPWHQSLDLTHHTQDGLPPGRLDARRNDEITTASFQSRLTRCFDEIARTLKDTGLVIFTYQHKTPQGWGVLGKALAQARLEVRRVFPMLGDTDAGPHKHSESIRWDAVIVAVPGRRESNITVLTDDARCWADTTANEWTVRLRNSTRLMFKAADEINLRRACYAAALSHISNTNSSSTSWNLIELLKLVDRKKESSTAVAAPDEASHRPLRPHRVPAPATA